MELIINNLMDILHKNRIMRAFITGATGFVGSHLTDDLISKGYEVKCLKRKTSSMKWLEGKNVEFVEGDLFSNEILEEAVKDVDYVFHIAGVVKAKNKEEFRKANYFATKNLLEICKKANPNLKKFILVSTQALCGPSPDMTPITEEYPPKPHTTYGITKLEGELEALKYKDIFPVTVVRPPAIYGPRDTEILIYFQMAAKGITPLIGFGDKFVSLIYVKDLTQGIILAAENENSNGEVFFISSDRYYNWKEVGETASSLMNKKSINIKFPHWLVYTVGFFAQIFAAIAGKAATLNIEKCWDLTRKAWICSNEKSKRMLGFQEKYSLKDGFKLTYEWYKQNNWIK